MNAYQNITQELNAPAGTTKAVVYEKKKKKTVEPFYYESVAFSYDRHGYEECVKTGENGFKIRFLPEEPGKLTVLFFNGETREIGRETIEVLPYTAPARLTVRNGLSYDSNGKLFVPVGVNLAFPESFANSNGKEFGLSGSISFLGIPQYEYWIKRFAESGVNLIRIWCGAAYFSPDTEKMGMLDFSQFEKLDRIFDLAQRYDVKIKLTIEKFRHFTDDGSQTAAEGQGGNIFKKYCLSDGEKIDDQEFLTKEKYRVVWLEKVKEYAKRYAEHPALFAVEFWNEMNAYGTGDKVALNDWNVYMSERVRALFPNVLILNSLGSLDAAYPLKQYNRFCFDQFDLLQFHSYLDQGAEIEEMRESPIEAIKKAVSLLREKKEECKKPLFLAETGAVNDNHTGPFRFYSRDDDGMILVDCVYTPFFLGCFGTGNMWYWDSKYIAGKNLYRYYLPIRRLIDSVDYGKESFVPIDLSTETFDCFVLKGKTSFLAFLRNKEYNWKNVLRDDKNTASADGEIPLGDMRLAELKEIPIWEDEQGVIGLRNGKLIIKNLKKGTLLKGFYE